MGPQSGLSKVRHLQKGGCRHRASLIHQDDQGESSLFGPSRRRKSHGEGALGAFRGAIERLTHTQNSRSLSTRPKTEWDRGWIGSVFGSLDDLFSGWGVVFRFFWMGMSCFSLGYLLGGWRRLDG